MTMLVAAASFATPVAAAPPGEVAQLGWCADSKDCLEWSEVAAASDYVVHRGQATDLPRLLVDAVASCSVGAFVEPTTGAILDDPTPGALHWFLVAARNVDGEGGAGAATDGPRVLDGDGPCAGVTADLILNEVDYDQPGTDFSEFVEILNTGSAPRDLTGISLILINGQSSSEYGRVDLADAGPTLAAGAFLVIGSPDVVAVLPPGTPSVTFSATTNNVQNGAPDGIALFDLGSGTLLDALSYEGEIHAAVIDGVPGTFDLVEGTAATAADSNSVAGSLARFPDGADTHDDDTDWRFNNVASPGSSNPIP